MSQDNEEKPVTPEAVPPEARPEKETPSEIMRMLGEDDAPVAPTPLPALDVKSETKEKKTSGKKPRGVGKDKTFDNVPSPAIEKPVTLTFDEKIAYIKSLAIRNERFSLTLAPDLKELASLKVVIRCRRRCESAVIEEVLKQDFDKGFGVVPLAVRVAMYSAACQVVSFGDQQLEPFSKEDATAPSDADIKRLRDCTDRMFGAFTEPEHFLLLDMLRTFESKLFKCSEGVTSADFLKAGG